MGDEMMDIDFRGGSLDDLRDFPEEARREAGYNSTKCRMAKSRQIGNPSPLLERAFGKSGYPKMVMPSA